MILHILLLILKFIGIAIAVLLGLLFLLLCIVLFVPVRYQIWFRCAGTKESLEVDVKASWLLRLIAARVNVRGSDTKIHVRAAWKTILPGKEAEGNASEPDMPQPKIKDAQIGTDMPQSQMEATQAERMQVEEKMIPEQSLEQSFAEGRKKEDSGEKQKKKQVSLIGKLRKLWNKITGIWEKIKYTIAGICDKINVFTAKKDHLVEFLTQETHQNAFRFGVGELKRTFLVLKPKELRGKLRFGFSDPYLTGKALAVLGVLYPFLGDTLEVTPEFEEAALEGEVFVRGKIRFGTFVRTAVRFLKNREVRATVRDIRKFRL